MVYACQGEQDKEHEQKFSHKVPSGYGIETFKGIVSEVEKKPGKDNQEQGKPGKCLHGFPVLMIKRVDRVIVLMKVFNRIDALVTEVEINQVKDYGYGQHGNDPQVPELRSFQQEFLIDGLEHILVDEESSR